MYSQNWCLRRRILAALKTFLFLLKRTCDLCRQQQKTNSRRRRQAATSPEPAANRNQPPRHRLWRISTSANAAVCGRKTIKVPSSGLRPSIDRRRPSTYIWALPTPPRLSCRLATVSHQFARFRTVSHGFARLGYRPAACRNIDMPAWAPLSPPRSMRTHSFCPSANERGASRPSLRCLAARTPPTKAVPQRERGCGTMETIQPWRHWAFPLISTAAGLLPPPACGTHPINAEFPSASRYAATCYGAWPAGRWDATSCAVGESGARRWQVVGMLPVGRYERGSSEHWVHGAW